MYIYIYIFKIVLSFMSNSVMNNLDSPAVLMTVVCAYSPLAEGCQHGSTKKESIIYE